MCGGDERTGGGDLIFSGTIVTSRWLQLRFKLRKKGVRHEQTDRLTIKSQGLGRRLTEKKGEGEAHKARKLSRFGKNQCETCVNLNSKYLYLGVNVRILYRYEISSDTNIHTVFIEHLIH